MRKVVTSFNFNPPLELFFCLPILTNNNLLYKIYCENIIIMFLNQNFFILFFFSFISLSSIRFFSFLFFFLLYIHVHYLYPPFFYFLFLFHSRTFQRALILSFFPQLSLFFSFFLFFNLILEYSLALFAIRKRKEKKRGIERKNKRDGLLCHRPSSSPRNVVQMGQMTSVFYLFFWINFKIVFLSLYSDNLIMLDFRDI